MEKARSLDELKQFLKDRYKAHDQIERLFYPEHPLPLAECYLDLGLIEEKVLREVKDKEGKDDAKDSVNKIEKDLSQREHFLHEYERIQHIQRKLDVKAILQECKTPKKRIYIEGAAGAGKSTLSRFIANEWAHGQAPWNQYEWVFFIRLRDLDPTNHPAQKALLQIVDSELFVGDGNHLQPSEYELFKNTLQQNPHQVLWILDGYDELNLDIARCNWWKDLLASNYHLLITSRPGAQLAKNDLAINLNLAVLGFSDEQVTKYINNFFDKNFTLNAQPEDATKCLALLKANPNLWSLAHTPIQLELLCSSWQEFANQPDLSLTQLYRIILERLLKRRALNEGLPLEESDPKVLHNHYADYLAYMEYLAFLGMQSQQIVLTEQQINKAYKILPSEKQIQTSFYKELKALGLVKRYNNGQQAEFIHLTFQEFFAARYVAKAIKAFSQGKPHSLSNDDLLDFIAKTKWNSFYEVMWWFVAGLLGEKQNTQQKSIEDYKLIGGDTNQVQELSIPKTHQRLQTLQTFFDLLLQEPRAELEAFELPLLAKCFAEAGAPNIMQREAIKLHYQAWLHFYWTSQDAYELQASALQKLIPLVKTNSLFIQWVEALCLTFNYKQHIISAIHSLGPATTGALQQELLALLQGDDWDVCESAAQAVGALGPAANAVLLQGLFALLEHRSKWVRKAAAEALGALGTVVNVELQQDLLSWLNHENSEVREEAAYTVGALGPAASETLQQGLLALLKDKDAWARKAAAEAVSFLGPTANDDLQQGLLALLNDQVWLVRKAVAEAVGALGSAATAALQEGLLALLNDKVWLVRKTAAEAVGALGSAANAALQQGLLALLEDPDKNVRIAAATVGTLGSAPNAVFQQCLLALLEDPDKDVRTDAAEAVGTLGSAANAVLQQGLLALLEDPDKDVRTAVIKALFKAPIGLVHACQLVFKNHPTYIPPSCLILSARDTGQVNHRGELNCLKLCGTVLQNIVQDGNQHNLTHEHWTIAMVRKKPTPMHNKKISSFFTLLKNLTSHAFLLIEGVKDGVRFAQKIDLYYASETESSSKSRGQKIMIKITNITDFQRLNELADNCYCMVQGVAKEKIETLMRLIILDLAKAERGEIVYNQSGDGSAALGQAKQHSCVSWCLEKWQQIGLPLKRKWYDPILVVAPAYLPAPEENNKEKGWCLVM